MKNILHVLIRWWLRLLGKHSDAAMGLPPLPARQPLPMFPAQTRPGHFKSHERWDDWFPFGESKIWAIFMRPDVAAARAAQTLNGAWYCNSRVWKRNKRVPS